MSLGMQQFNIGRMLAGTRIDSEMFDIRAHLDSTLTYGENLQNIRSIAGISTRDKGMEQHHQRGEERARERARRKSDPLRQSGRIQGSRGHQLDARLQAQRPGKRHSRNGIRYYERRENRSDRGKFL